MDRTLVHSLTDLPDVPHVVTIGSFDGVHRGHQHLIDRVTEQACALGMASLAITFDPLPAEVLRPDKAPPRLCTTAERTFQMREHGIDRIAVLSFDEAMANQSADDFLRELVEAARPAAIVVGEDFAFGHKRQGTPSFLQSRAGELGYQLEIVERINPEEDLEWSSSFVRRQLSEHGDARTAGAVLGRPFRLSGVVQNGDHRGRDLGYPTANLNLPPGLIVPADGIYAALVTISDIQWPENLPSLVYVGTRPTFESTSRVIEVFLLDFDADLYGRKITVDFLDRIRGDRAFDSADELVNQMKQDEADGRRILAEYATPAGTNPQEQKRSR